MEFKRFLGNLTKSFLVVGALSVSAFAGADTNNYQAGCAQPCAPACNTAGCCCGQPCCEPPACGWAYNPPGYCHCNCNPTNCCDSCDGGWGLELDFLWWRACATGMNLGHEEASETFVNNGERQESDQTYTVLNDSHAKGLDMKYDPGFRIGLYNLCACECWDIGLVWTHYHTKATATGSSFCDGNSNVKFFNAWERAKQGGRESEDFDYVADFAKGRYSMTLDMLDLEFGRKYYVSSCFVLRPSFGLRGARMDQNYRVESEANRGFGGGARPGSDFISHANSRNDFLALGPRVGLDAEVHLGCGFALFGEAAGSLLFGRFERHSKEHLHDFGTCNDDFVNDFFYETKSGSERCSRAVTDLSFGFKWSRCFDWCNRLHPVSVAFAWEHHAFWNFNNFNFAPNAYDIQEGSASAGGARKSGDLYTQGLTVKANFGF